MRKLLLSLLILLATMGASDAHNRVGSVVSHSPVVRDSFYPPVFQTPRTTKVPVLHKRKHHTYKRTHKHSLEKVGTRSGVVMSIHSMATVQTKAGPIVVNPAYMDRFKGFIDALPYIPRRVHCYASNGHVSNSNHYRGAACDIDQSCWGCTSPQMHHITALATQWGLRDGCSFGDCGHVDVPVNGVASVIKHPFRTYMEIKPQVPEEVERSPGG